MTKSAIVLFSGGLDSTTCLGMAIEQGFDPIPISFSYGQRHSVELECAKRVLKHYGVDRHHIIELGFFREFGGSALTADIPVPQHETVDDLGDGIPVTYVPGRNIVFLSQAVSIAEATGSSDIFIGVNALDYSGYPDCRPEFIEAFSKAANLATKAGTEDEGTLTFHTPLIDITKAQIIQKGMSIGVPYHLTHSCYSPVDGIACGHCDSCLLRLKGFQEAGHEDPVPYASAPVS
jgi:7-cyano-7-deazaguanine synthase